MIVIETILAVLPSIVIFLIITGMDRERKTKGFLFALFGMGVVSIIPAVVLELIMEGLMRSLAETHQVLYTILFYFLVVAVVEEGCKFGVMALMTWNNRRFNSTYDGIVYMVCTALGFATLENLLYVYSSGVGVALVRAILTVPGHAMWGIIIGYGYGITKFRCVTGSDQAAKPLVLSLLIAMFSHGFYDCLIALAQITGDDQVGVTGLLILTDLVFVVLCYIFVFRKAAEAARNDVAFVQFMPAFQPNYSYQTYIPFVGSGSYTMPEGFFPAPLDLNMPQQNPYVYHYGPDDRSR